MFTWRACNLNKWQQLSYWFLTTFAAAGVFLCKQQSDHFVPVLIHQQTAPCAIVRTHAQMSIRFVGRDVMFNTFSHDVIMTLLHNYATVVVGRKTPAEHNQGALVRHLKIAAVDIHYS